MIQDVDYVTEMQKMDITYTDFYGEKAYLTTQEINWFRDVCELCKAATSINLPIEPHNHEKLHGKQKEALAFICTDNKDDPFAGDTVISVDTYFIHECYLEVFQGICNLSLTTLEEAIAHEFAHCFQWRHCKRHDRITEMFYQKIKNYAKKQNTA